MTSTEVRLPLSAILREISLDPDPTVAVGEIVHRFGRRAFGALLFIFSAPNWLPLPPGSSSFLSVPLVLLSPQVAVGIQSPWLPGFIDDRTMKRSDMRKAVDKLLPTLERIEKVSRPRWGFMFGAVGDRMIGLTCFLLSLVLILPIPLGNMAPAAAIAAFGLSLVQRDGILTLIGYAISGISVGLLILGYRAALLALDKVLAFFGLA